ncbi:ABC transporter permease [Anaeromicropila populeti]|uniref:Putative ABC transport system permease protein n=1 Tax=Anaeromicropila populeti TaxID=37658 RepID=A0A1I6HIR7_9FIRM|nr:FtsX-like permease family protein [Anaeromicropila populeti]SFR54296.1 putative ABC transport system permease protein [Anaeromicropila populeti]
MRIFFKYVLKSMTEKKGRFLLLIVAISISTALLVASTGMIDIIMDSLIKPQLETFEGKDMVISSKDQTSYFYSDENMKLAGVEEESLLKELYITGNIVDKPDTDDEAMLNITVLGRDTKYIDNEMITQGDIEAFTGAVCMISERTAEEKKTGIGDTLDIIIGGVTKSLKVAAISAPAGVFYNDSSTSFSVMVPYDYLSSDLGAEGKYNLIIGSSAEKTVQEGIDQFNENNEWFTAEELFDEDTIKEQASSFTSILYMMLIIVVAMSSIIIYSSFKLIITERLKTIGTFLSQGATVGKVRTILYLESCTYGLFGAVIGITLGVIGLHVINRLVSPLKDYGIYGEVVIEPHYVISGIIFAVVLSILSSYLPVRKISKLQVKDIILNDVRITKTIGWKKCIAGTVITAGSVAAYVFAENKLGVYSALLIISSLIGVILAYPKLIDLLSGLLYHIFRGRSKNVIYAINNLRTSKVLLGNISLIIISLTSIIAIQSVGASMIDIVTEAYTKLQFDVEISGISTIRENSQETTEEYLVKKLESFGVKENQINKINYFTSLLSVPDTDTEMGLYAMGVNPDTYLSYNQYLELDKPEYSQYLEDFKEQESGVIISTVVSKNLGSKLGDTIEVTCMGVKKPLKVVGIINGKLFNGGFFILIQNSTLDKVFGVSSVNRITFVTDQDADLMMDKLKPVLREIGATAVTKAEMEKVNLKQNQMVVNGLSIFSYMAIIIAALGIVNNVAISFLQRKSEFAVLASIGMEDSGRTKILFFESIASVTWAMGITILYSMFAVRVVSSLTKAAGLSMDIKLDYQSLPFVYLISLAIVLCATIPTYWKSRKFSIVQELKYE